MPFEYRPLAEGEIRLFYLLPKFRGRGVCGIIKHINLNSDPTPQYKTLSYAWGDPQVTTPIKMRYHDDTNNNFHEFHVTVNLAAAFRQMRSHWTPLVIWADAVCIDQGNIEERDREVLRMGIIYKKCTQVNIWLGRLNENTDPMFNGIKDPKEAMLYNAKAIKTALESKKIFLEHDEDESREFKASQQAIDGIICLTTRPWFTRLWVLQECVLPPSQLVMIGPKTISFQDLQKIWIQVLYYVLFVQRRYGGGWEDALEASHGLFTVVDDVSKENFSTQSQDTQLWNILINTVGLATTNDLDRVYGVLGLIKDCQSTEELRPDYKKTFSQLRHELALYFISRDNLQFLATCHDNPDALPSWTPNLDLQSDDVNGIVLSKERETFLSPCKQLLHLRAVLYGNIEHLIYLTDQECTDASDIQQWLTDAYAQVDTLYSGETLSLAKSSFATVLHGSVRHYLDFEDGCTLKELCNSLGDDLDKFVPLVAGLLVKGFGLLANFRYFEIVFAFTSTGQSVQCYPHNKVEKSCQIILVPDIIKGLVLSPGASEHRRILSTCFVPSLSGEPLGIRQKLFDEAEDWQWFTLK